MSGGKLYVSTDVEALWHDMNDSLIQTALQPIDLDPFWETFYNSHWTAFSIEDKRQLFYQSFLKNNY